MHRLVGGSRGAYGVIRAQSYRLSDPCVRLPPTSTTRMNAGLCVSTDGHMPVFNLKDSEAHLSLGTKTTSLMKVDKTKDPKRWELWHFPYYG